MDQEKDQTRDLHESAESETSSATEPVENQKSQRAEKKSNINFDFKRSVDETKGIVLDAILRPHSVVKSDRSIGLDTSAMILFLLSFVLGAGYFLFYKFGFEGMLNWFNDVGILFFFSALFSWALTFAIGYFSLYFLLLYFGNTKLPHRELLTKYAIVNIPFTIIFSLVILFFGFLLVDLFVITYVFALMLYGVIHVYLFMVNAKQPKFDLFWTMTGYLLLLTVITYFFNGVDFTSF